MKVLKGKRIADKILKDLKGRIKKEKTKPALAVVLVGDDKASRIYVNLKKKAAKKIGINFQLNEFPKNSDEKGIIKKIKELNADKKISGIIVQLPLPKKLNTQKIINTIDPKKDADGFSAKSKIDPVFPKAIVEMIKSAKKDLKGRKGMVIANSEMFGKIMAEALRKIGLQAEYVLGKDAKKYAYCLRRSNVVVTAMGKPQSLKGNMFKDGAIIIDGGIAKRGKKVFGDVDVKSIQDKNIFLSPVPGGVGPVTIACLLENVYLLAKKNFPKTKF